MFKHRRNTLAALVLALGAIGSAQAESYLDQIGRLDAQIALQRKQIEAKNLAIEAAGTMTLPRVRFVSGFDDELSASVTYGNGRTTVVKRGDHLPGGIEVKGVRRQGVLVEVGKREMLLEFTAPGDGAPGAPSQSRPLGLVPPLPMVNVPLPSSLGSVGGGAKSGERRAGSQEPPADKRAQATSGEVNELPATGGNGALRRDATAPLAVPQATLAIGPASTAPKQ